MLFIVLIISVIADAFSPSRKAYLLGLARLTTHLWVLNIVFVTAVAGRLARLMESTQMGLNATLGALGYSIIPNP